MCKMKEIYMKLRHGNSNAKEHSKQENRLRKRPEMAIRPRHCWKCRTGNAVHNSCYSSGGELDV